MKSEADLLDVFLRSPDPEARGLTEDVCKRCPRSCRSGSFRNVRRETSSFRWKVNALSPL